MLKWKITKNKETFRQQERKRKWPNRDRKNIQKREM